MALSPSTGDIMKPEYDQLFARNRGFFSQGDIERIRSTRLVILGLGGTGGTAAVLLARTGFERFVLCDFDSFEVHNMNRQVGCSVDTIGQPKVTVYKDLVLNINPHAEVKTYCEKANQKLMESILQEGDIVLLCIDEDAYGVVRGVQKGRVPIIAGLNWGAMSICTTFVPSQGCDYLEWIGFEFPWLTKRAWKALRGDTGFTEEWLADADRGKAYPTTMGITTWLWSAIASAEVVKIVTERWEVVVAPRYWYITPRIIEIRQSVPYKGIVRCLIEEARS